MRASTAQGSAVWPARQDDNRGRPGGGGLAWAATERAGPRNTNAATQVDQSRSGGRGGDGTSKRKRDSRPIRNLYHTPARLGRRDSEVPRVRRVSMFKPNGGNFRVSTVYGTLAIAEIERDSAIAIYVQGVKFEDPRYRDDVPCTNGGHERRLPPDACEH